MTKWTKLCKCQSDASRGKHDDAERRNRNRKHSGFSPSPMFQNISLLVFIIEAFQISIGNVKAISVHSQQQSQPRFIGVGVTSVHSDNSSLLVGTKRGGIYCVLDNEKKQDSCDDSNSAIRNKSNKIASDENDIDNWSKLKSKNYETKHPIYSIAMMDLKSSTSPALSPSLGSESFLFCGSGDRFVSVWKINRNQQPPFEFIQKLGAHTGWVKDLVYDRECRVLHSIGCNCIESWDCSGLEKGQSHLSLPITHIAKRTIESSPRMGTTLSSDLLCLCLVPSNKTKNESHQWLVSGGVDGRIHLWLSDPNAQSTDGTTNLNGKVILHTALAHDGRVNSIVYSSAIDAIFTVGNDGVLCVFRVSLGSGFQFVSKLKLEEDIQENTSRITVASITKDLQEEKECSLALGSSKGCLYFVRASVNAEGSIESQIEEKSIIITEDSMIYSISSEELSDTTGSAQLWVGHASGLSTVNYSL